MKGRGSASKAITLLATISLVGACDGNGSILGRLLDRTPRPDSLPVMLNSEHPFRYPPELYAQRVQGNVSLRVFIDANGKIHPDSTIIVESSGKPALDSAALTGSRELRFSPATRKGKPMPVSIIYPVYFRHPEGTALPGDTILRKSDRKGGGDGETGGVLPR